MSTNPGSNRADTTSPPEQSQLQYVASARAVVIALSFWSAVVLPAFYLPLLVIGLETTLFLLLIGVNVVALVAGHSYGSE